MKNIYENNTITSSIKYKLYEIIFFKLDSFLLSLSYKDTYIVTLTFTRRNILMTRFSNVVKDDLAISENDPKYPSIVPIFL